MADPAARVNAGTSDEITDVQPTLSAYAVSTAANVVRRSSIRAPPPPMGEQAARTPNANPSPPSPDHRCGGLTGLTDSGSVPVEQIARRVRGVSGCPRVGVVLADAARRRPAGRSSRSTTTAYGGVALGRPDGPSLLDRLAGAPASAAPAALPDDKMVVDVVAANGSGCPSGTADVTVSPDNTAFTVTYSQFTAQTGVGAKPTDFRKNCQLALNVHVPQGFTYAVAGADYRGYAHLDRGASGSESANYYFQGEPQSTRIRHDFTGPADNDWQRTDNVGIASLSFLPCGEQRYLNVNTELRVSRGWSSPRATNFLTMDSTDGRIDTIYHVAWKQC